MGSRPASASVPPVGDVLKQLIIHSVMRRWTADSCLVIPLSLAPWRYHSLSPYVATGTMHMQ